jgi:hypothetical protein
MMKCQRSLSIVAKKSGGTSQVPGSTPERISGSRLKKSPRCASRALLGYGASCATLRWAVAEWAIVAVLLVMGDQGLGAFLTEIC